MASSSKESDVRQPQQRSFYTKWFDDWWAWELLSLVLSCALVVALCVILASYNGTSAPAAFSSVVHRGITLNTVVSLISTVAVAAALNVVQSCLAQLKWTWYAGPKSRPLGDLATFDEASRGLQGSAQLLWKLKLPPVASVGALLVMVQLAIAPLAQQSLQYELQPVRLSTQNATVSIATEWGEGWQQTQTKDMPYGNDALGSGMKGAVKSGLFTPSKIVVNHTVPACLTGNCTFDAYQTLAVCPFIADVSSELEYKTKKDASSYCLPGDGDLCLNNDPLNGKPIAWGNITSAASYVDIYEPWSTDDGELSSLNYTSMAFSDHVTRVLDGYVIYKNMTEPGPDQHDFHAVEFVLDWCLASFNTTVVNGTATTVRLDDDLSLDFEVNSMGDFAAESNGTEFTVDYKTHFTLQRYLAMLFSGTITTTGTDNIATTDEAGVIGLAMGLTSGETDENSNRIQDLAVLDAVMENVATSMTNFVREQSYSGGTAPLQFNGTIWQQQNTVTVSWGWVAAPIVFTAISLCFFVAAVVMGGRAGPAQWKSSPTALLHGPDSQLHAALGVMVSKSAMNARSNDIRVRLVRDGDGWRLTGAGGVSSESTEYIALHPQKQNTQDHGSAHDHDTGGDMASEHTRLTEFL